MERPALLAGQWYPADASSCRAEIERHARGATPDGRVRGGLIGPHAGWTFSGDCAGRTYAWLAGARSNATLAVVFGSHRGPSGPNSVFRGGGWATPLGPLETHRALADAAQEALGLTDEPIRPARPDNAVELHLPFVKHFFGRARLLMIGVAAAPIALAIGRAVGGLVKASGEDAVFIGSTDLTHYGPNYGFAPAGVGPASVAWVRDENDRGFLDALLADDPEAALAHATARQSACCPGAAVAALEAVRAARGAVDPILVDHSLSYDVRPDASFVGYGGLVV